ncbi:glycosyltransferase family 4 protein [Telluribacter sp. SYSU D00476]|uniref:glycosyltransferase family 4 protein n=1 Tax=Telluribacter sp. SYSU D00476 TaxID=2811430 RepID=UPI001FF335CC|nr:glycosyltransferase family 4 protein [Telluribacter sp. SYSU D00476]
MGGAVEKRWYAMSKMFGIKGHEVTYISRKVPELSEREIEGNIQHIRIKGYDTPASGIKLKYLDLLYTIRAQKYLKDDFDVIISNTFWAPILLPQAKKKVCMVDVARFPKGQMPLYKQAAVLRANSNVIVEAIKKELPDVSGNKVVMIPNPLPFVPSEEVDFSIKKDKILYVGRIHQEKGLDLLIRAHKLLHPDTKLELVGPWEVAAGGGGKEYLDRLKKLSAGANVEFIGPVYDTNQLNQFYREASLFVYPSVAEKGETFGLAPLEAMAWGCVPIVSDLACFKDFIIAEKNGLTFDHRSDTAISQLSEILHTLLADQVYRYNLATEAIKVRVTHSVSYIADQFLAEFERIQSK